MDDIMDYKYFKIPSPLRFSGKSCFSAASQAGKGWMAALFRIIGNRGRKEE